MQIHENISLGHAHQLSSNEVKTSHGITSYMPYHGVENINQPKCTNTCSNSTIKALNQRPRILMWCLILLTLLYFFSGTILVGVQQESSDAIQCLYQHTIRYELNQKHVRLKFNLSSSQWMTFCVKAMVKFIKRLKEIVQIMYLHWVGSVLTSKRIVSGNLFLIKVTKREKLSSNSLRDTLGRS